MVQRNQYAGYFQLGSDEAYGHMGLTKQQFAQLPFDKQMDAYTKWAKRNDPTGEHLTNLGLFNAASNIKLQTAPLDKVVYHASGGTAFEAKAARANAPTWGRYSPGGAGGDITIGGIEKYYGRGDEATRREIAEAGGAAAPVETAQADRSMVDRRSVKTVKVDATGSVKVNVASAGSDATLGSEKLFKPTTPERSTQMAAAESGPRADAPASVKAEASVP
jgi:hypothetical protein